MTNILIGIGVFYVILLLVLFVFQKQFVFHPESEIQYTPASAGLEFESVKVTTVDDEEIHGWFIPHQDPRCTLLYFHGNAGNISDRVESVKMLWSLGVNVFIFDYRGYGQSTGIPGEAGTYRDARATWSYLTEEKNIPAEDILLYGRSLGGAVAIELATRIQPGGLIVGSSFTSARAMARKMFPYVPIGILMSISYNSKKRIAKVKTPVLITHSENDDLIPFEMGRELFEAANDPKEFVQLQGGHNDNIFVSRDIYLESIDKFVARYFD